MSNVNSKNTRFQTRSPSNRPSFGGGNSQGPSSKQASPGGSSPFTRLGSIALSKSNTASQEEIGDFFELAQRLKLNIKVYLGKEGGNVTLNSGDYITLNFARKEDDKDFVLGFASVINS